MASIRCKMIWKELDTMTYYNYAVLKMKSSSLSIISVVLWRLEKQFWAPIFSFKKTQKLSHYPLKLPLLGVTGEICINLLSSKQTFVFRWITYERNFTCRNEKYFAKRKGSFVRAHLWNYALKKTLFVINRRKFRTRNFPNEYRQLKI